MKKLLVLILCPLALFAAESVRIQDLPQTNNSPVTALFPVLQPRGEEGTNNLFLVSLEAILGSTVKTGSIAQANLTMPSGVSGVLGGTSGGAVGVLNGVVTVIEANGLAPMYYAPSSDTDLARGVAIASAFSAASAGATIQIGPGRYDLPSSLSILDKQSVKLFGAVIQSKDVSTDVFAVSGKTNWSISGSGILMGHGFTAGTTNDESGIRLTGANLFGWVVSGLQLRDFKGCGIATSTTASSEHNGGSVIGVEARNNSYGWYSAAGSEYPKISASSFISNTFGMYVGGGNITVGNCVITDNTTGVYLDNGVNHSHGVFSGCEINHNATDAVYANQIQYGMTFSGCHFFGNKVTLNACMGVSIIGGMGSPNFVLVGTMTGYNWVKDFWFQAGEPTVTATTLQRPFLRIEQSYTTTGLSAYANSPIQPRQGGTGTTNAPVNGPIIYSDVSSNFTHEASFSRSGGGILTHTGLLNQTNSASATIISSGVHDNVGLVIRGVSDSSPASVTPSDIANIEFWFKADSLALSDGAVVSTWADSSGNSRNATQGTGANQPIYKTGVLNSQPIVRFDGNDYLDTASISKSQPLTIFVVAQESITENRILFTWGTGMSLSYNGLRGLWYGGASLLFDVVPTRWNLYDIVANGASSKVSVNGSVDTTGSGGSTTPNAAFRIGEYTEQIGTYGWKGDIAEIVVYSGALTAAEREGVRRYLQVKYGLIITPGGAGTLSSQTADLQQWQNEGATNVAKITASGAFANGGGTNLWIFKGIDTTAGTTNLIFNVNGQDFWLLGDPH